MEVGDWITLAAVIVALGIGVASILHTQSSQKRERKERLLNEIIEWATDISTCSFKTDKYALANVVKIDLLLVNLAALEDQYNSVRMKGKYIQGIASAFGTDLGNSVHEVITKLDEHIEIIRKYMYTEEEIKLENSAKELPEQRKFLIQSVDNMTQKAIKIKTRDIG
jgi:hypothetical protein